MGFPVRAVLLLDLFVWGVGVPAFSCGGWCVGHPVRLNFLHYDHEEERQMDEWHDFFLAQAGAAGVLTGLVFVAVSINLQQILSDPGSGLAGRRGGRPAPAIGGRAPAATRKAPA